MTSQTTHIITTPQARSYSREESDPHSAEELEALWADLAAENDGLLINLPSDVDPPEAGVGPAAWLADAGVDTLSLAWRPRSPALWRRLAAAARCGLLSPTPGVASTGSVRRTSLPLIRKRGSKAKTYRSLHMVGMPLAGVNWLIDIHHRLIYCEGRLVCLLANDPGATGLASRHDLGEAARLAAAALAGFGVVLDPVDARVRRLDYAVDFGFAHGVCGEVLLEEARRCLGERVLSWGGRLLTSVASFDSHGRIRWRVYDKGVERVRKSAGREACEVGRLIRIERQFLYDKQRQKTAGEIVWSIEARWMRELASWLPKLPALGRFEEAVDMIFDQANSGSLKVETADRLMGLMLKLERRGRDAWPDTLRPDTRRRERNRAIQQLRRRGVEVTWPERGRDKPSGTAWCRMAGRSVAPDHLMGLLGARLTAEAELLGS